MRKIIIKEDMQIVYNLYTKDKKLIDGDYVENVNVKANDIIDCKIIKNLPSFLHIHVFENDLIKVALIPKHTVNLLPGNRSLGIIKPNVVKNKLYGDVIQFLLDLGFDLIKIKKQLLTLECVSELYKPHFGKEYFQRHVDFMCSGDSILLLLEKDNCIEDLIKVKKEIREIWGGQNTENSFHSSDSEDEFIRELEILQNANF